MALMKVFKFFSGARNVTGFGRCVPGGGLQVDLSGGRNGENHCQNRGGGVGE